MKQLEQGTTANLTFTVTTDDPRNAGLGGAISGSLGGDMADLLDVEGDEVYPGIYPDTEHTFTARFGSASAIPWTRREIEDLARGIIADHISSRLPGVNYTIKAVTVSAVQHR